MEKYVVEKLQEVYNGSDTITKITHVGTKADISQIIHQHQQTLGQIIYEVKNEKWLSKNLTPKRVLKKG